jgi:hypothetical protein
MSLVTRAPASHDVISTATTDEPHSYARDQWPCNQTLPWTCCIEQRVARQVHESAPRIIGRWTRVCGASTAPCLAEVREGRSQGLWLLHGLGVIEER